MKVKVKDETEKLNGKGGVACSSEQEAEFQERRDFVENNVQLGRYIAVHIYDVNLPFFLS